MVVRQHQTDFLPVLEEIFLKQRNDPVAKHLLKGIKLSLSVGNLLQAGEIGMANAVVTVVKCFDAPVDCCQHLRNVDDFVIEEYAQTSQWCTCLITCIWKNGYEFKTAAKCSIQKRQRPVCRIHRADDVNVGRNTKRLTRIWKCHRHRMRTTFTLVSLNQGDQLTEDLADIAAVDFIDNHGKSLIRCQSGTTAQVFEHPRPDFVLHVRLICAAGQDRAQAFNKFFIAIGLVKSDEAVTLDGTGRLWALFQFIDQLSEVGTVILPVTGKPPKRRLSLVEDRRSNAHLHVDRCGFFNRVVLKGAPQRVLNDAQLGPFLCGHRLRERMLGNVTDLGRRRLATHFVQSSCSHLPPFQVREVIGNELLAPFIIGHIGCGTFVITLE